MTELWMDVDAALAEVPVNLFPLIDDTDFKTREVAIVYNQAGMDLVWNFVTPAGAWTQTAVTPTTAGVHDWVHVGDGMYSIEIPASAGTINNDTEGFGWFTGICTGVLPWRGPVIGFRDALLNNLLIETAYSATRGLAGTALPAVAAEAVGGIYTRGTGAGQINQDGNGRVDVNIEAVSADAAMAAVLELFLEILNQSTGQLDSGSLDATLDTYQSKTTVVDDDGNTADRYGVEWFKNSEPISSGITSPTIQVIKATDGTDLVASTAMTEVASLQVYRYDETTGANRMVDGALYRVKTQATIGGSTRTWGQWVFRDSSA